MSQDHYPNFGKSSKFSPQSDLFDGNIMNWGDGGAGCLDLLQNLCHLRTNVIKI